MDEIRDEILKSIKENRFFYYLHEIAVFDHKIINQLYQTLIELHNNGVIDVVSIFQTLRDNNQEVCFFNVVVIFEKILPKLEAPVPQVVQCVLHLIKEAKGDRLAFTIIKPYIEYCSSDPSRPKESIELIEESVDTYCDFLAPTLIGGSRLDADYYLKETIRLMDHTSIQVRRKAVFALGRLDYHQNSLLIEKATAKIEDVIRKEIDDELISLLIKTSFELYIHHQPLEKRVIRVITVAVGKGLDCSLHSISKLLWHHYKEIPDPLLDVIANNFEKEEHQGRFSITHFFL